jgi:hypothetical protein
MALAFRLQSRVHHEAQPDPRRPTGTKTRPRSLIESLRSLFEVSIAYTGGGQLFRQRSAYVQPSAPPRLPV